MASQKTTPEQQELDRFYKPYLSDESDYSDDSEESVSSKGSEGSEDSEDSEDSESSVSSEGSEGSVSSKSSEGSEGSEGNKNSESSKTNNNLDTLSYSKSNINNNQILALNSNQNIFASNGFPVSEMSGDKIPSKSIRGPAIFNQPATTFTVSKNTTTVMINSSDRDTNIYPQPSHFTLRVPRIYRNVIGINITQIKLLSSFYYFSLAKNNTNLRILEYGRKITNSKGESVDNPINIFIKDGSYNTDQIVSELQNRLNTSPIYSNITIDKFFDIFFSTGNYEILFNDPGDTTYNPLTGLFDVLQNKAQIVNRYFNSAANTNISYYTTNQCLVAYYYPMLRDMTISNIHVVTPPVSSPYATYCSKYVNSYTNTYDPLNFYINDLSGVSYYDRIIYGFQGLNDPYITTVISDPANQVILQKYKDDNTWKAYLLNSYTCNYDSTNGRLNIFSSHLNTSLVRTFYNEYTDILNQAYIDAGIDPTTVPTKQADAENQNGVVIDMYNFIQTAFTNTFAVNYGAYTPSFFTDISNSVFLNTAAGRYGWNLTYTGSIPQLSTSNIVYPDASGSYPGLVFDPNKMNKIGSDLYYDKPSGTVQYTYTYNPSVDSNNNLLLSGSNEETLGFCDISFNILPTTYVRVPIKSRCRQTLYIETIPPYSNEITPTNNLTEQYFMDPVNTPLLYEDTTGEINLIDPTNPNFFLFDISQNMLDGPEYMRQTTSYGRMYQNFIRQQKPINIPDIIPPPGSLNIFPFRQHVFLEIHHSIYPAVSTDTLFASDIYIEVDDDPPNTTLIGVDLDAFWYRDRAAFMSDVYNILGPNDWNNPKNYFKHIVIPATSSRGILTTNFISGQTSYLMITTKSISFSKLPLRIFVLLHNKYGVYSIPSVSDYRLLPIDTTYLSTKTTPLTNEPTQFPTLFNSSGFRNCYDLNSVSNNILDYYVFTNSKTHYDPYSLVNNTNIFQSAVQYIFRLTTPAVDPPINTRSYSQFFSSGSSNQIVDSINNTVYYNSSKAAAEISNGVLPFPGISNDYVFVNWFKAGATENIYDVSTSPSIAPEQTIAPYPKNDINGVDNPFSIFDSIDYSSLYTNPNYSQYKYSPFSLCKNTQYIATDISFNNLSSVLNLGYGQIYLGPDINTNTNNILGIMGIPFIPPLGHYIAPKQIIIKFAYTQPSYDLATNQIGRTTSLNLITSQEYRYITNANSSLYTNPIIDLQQFDDHFYQNRRNVVLGVFFSKDIQGKNIANISLSSALFTLTLKKISQIVEYSSSSDPNKFFSRTRSPDWGTYYVYETSNTVSNHWTPVTQQYLNGLEKTQWAAIQKQADIGDTVFTTIHSSSGTDNKSYYTDISNNSLCFVPFYPVLSNEQLATTQDKYPNTAPFIIDYTKWAVGTFSGLTYTSLPYVPITKASALTDNPYVFYNDNNGNSPICVEQIGTGGISLGDTSTYLGSVGPLCWGYNENGTIVSPNYRFGQPFKPTFFNIKINLTISYTKINPLTNLSAFGGSTQVDTCYSDTQMYIYNSSDIIDIDYSDIIRSWGFEKASNFRLFDGDSGFNYLSYIPNIKVEKGSSYTVHVRGYIPSVKIRTGIRIVGKNWTDFGEVTLKNLCDEIADLINGGVSISPDGSLINDNYRISQYYSSNYARTILLFNNLFIGTKIFGQGFTKSNFAGQTITSTGFADFLNQYKAIYDTFYTISNNLSAVQITANNNMQAFIIENYTNILPDYALTRSNINDPLSFSILFKSALIPPYITAFDQWGLGWNLGFTKADTPYATRHVANTFIKIVDDFIYFMLDETLNLNGIDISNKEDLSLSRDTFGQKQKYYGKLLLNTFGSFAQTFVQSAKLFTTPIAKIDKLTFKLFDINNVPINNNDCEYNIVMEITELVDNINTQSAIVMGSK